MFTFPSNSTDKNAGAAYQYDIPRHRLRTAYFEVIDTESAVKEKANAAVSRMSRVMLNSMG